ncbi:MAG: hypothetical protein KJ818_03720 [Candidatus Omnitrophica bacterium]|nr:hypothetical protein [Candidatus Omnitrophota bacterium]
MFIYLKKRKGQTTLEYAILIGVIVAGLIAMQIYVKRGYMGKMRESADDMGKQFAPGASTYTYTYSSHSQTNETVQDGKTTTKILTSTSNKTGSEQVQDQESDWSPWDEEKKAE